jgi:hypothetical protein
MLSKAKGQILRVAATLHVLFHIDTPLVIPSVIANNAVEAAIDLVDVCIQQAAYLAGRGDVKEAIEELAKGCFMNNLFYVYSCNFQVGEKGATSLYAYSYS